LIDSGVVVKFFTVLAREVIGANDFQAIVETDGTEDLDTFVGKIGENPMMGHVSILASVGGGAYLVWGQYIGLEMLHEAGVFLRGLDEVLRVELHALIGKAHKGSQFRFKKAHLKVLRSLVDDPRKPIADIVHEVGMSPKTVRRVLTELEESEGVWFVARPDLATGSLVNIHIRIKWNEKRVSIEELVEWLRNEYPVAFWIPWVSASDSVVFAEFVVNDLHEAESIARKIRGLDYVESTSTLVSYSNAKFPYPAETKLVEMLDEAGV
jgi:DNA-binding Lrp family transcriptional regulator